MGLNHEIQTGLRFKPGGSVGDDVWFDTTRSLMVPHQQFYVQSRQVRVSKTKSSRPASGIFKHNIVKFIGIH